MRNKWIDGLDFDGTFPSCRLKKVIISCVPPTRGIVSSGGPTATLGTDVSRLLVQGCRTAFQLVLGKQTSAIVAHNRVVTINFV